MFVQYFFHCYRKYVAIVIIHYVMKNDFYGFKVVTTFIICLGGKFEGAKRGDKAAASRMDLPSLEELSTLPRKKLQRICKVNCVKANLKVCLIFSC